MASFGWGYVPMQAASASAAAAAAAADEHIEAIPLVTNRASAPTIGEFLAELYNSEVLSDITICSEDGQAIRCHKLVLVRWSAPLRRMLCGDMREARERRITLRGVDGEVLAAFLRFMYTCSASIPPDKLVGLAAMADQYDVTLLQQLCMEAIRMHVSNHRCCCLFYKAAKEIQQQEIQQLAWQQLANNLNTLVRQHDVFVQLELEDVLRLCGRRHGNGTAVAAVAASASVAEAAGDGGGGSRAGVGGAAGPSNAGAEAHLHGLSLAAGSQPQPAAGQQEQHHHHQPLAQPPPRLQFVYEPLARRSSLAGPPAHTLGGLLQPQPPPPRRPEYALFLALMAWLTHDASRHQHKQLLLGCVDFDAMTSSELSQMRSSPHVQGDAELKELLLDAFARRCLQHSQQPVFHMAPLPHDNRP